MKERKRVPLGAAILFLSLGYLLGVQHDGLARVMWVEDHLSSGDQYLLNLVNSWPPFLVVANILAIVGVVVGALMWILDSRSSISKPIEHIPEWPMLPYDYSGDESTAAGASVGSKVKWKRYKAPSGS